VVNKSIPDYVFHLAAESRIQPAIQNPSRAYSVNVMGTLNILELSKKFNIKRAIDEIISIQQYQAVSKGIEISTEFIGF
jgi:nucleoside-diphosphate-sugar epimerase